MGSLLSLLVALLVLCLVVYVLNYIVTTIGFPDPIRWLVLGIAVLLILGNGLGFVGSPLYPLR